MSNAHFPHRLAALALVGLTLAGVASLVGTSENEGALASATDRLSGQEATPQATAATATATTAAPMAAPTPVRPAPAAPVPIEFAEDESLIDTAQGIDPTPQLDDPADGEVVVVIEEGRPVEGAPSGLATEP